MTGETGEELFACFLDGDESAFEGLVTLYRPGLMQFLIAMVGDYEDAEDLLVDTFASLAANGDRFQGRSSLKTYLFAIGRNLAAKHLRRRRGYPSLSNTSIGQSCAPEREQPEQLCLSTERDRQVYAALQRLNPDYRQVLYLLYFEKIGHADAGQVMQKSLKQIDNLAQRGRAALKRILESDGFHYEDG